MLNLKKFYSDELLQIALLLSLMRVDPDSYVGLDIQTVNVGSLDLNNGSNWNNDAHHTIIHRPAFVHPKNLDSLLLNYERDLFEDLNALGRYNIINNARNDIHAYLLNVNETTAGPSAVVTETAENARNATNSPDPPMPTQTADDSLGAAELTQEDMDLIEVLWKQDVDLGFTIVDPTKSTATSSKKESEDDIEKLKTLEAINAADDKKKSDVQEESPKEDDPWAELQYTVDLETGEYILSTASGGSGCSSASSDVAESQQLQVEEDAERRLLGEAGLGLGDVDELVGLGEDSLGLGLENDFTSELLGDSLLNDSVDGLLNNESLGLPDGFNLEEALQLVGLDEVQLEKKDVKKKSEKTATDGPRGSSESRASTSKNPDEDQKDTEPADMMMQYPVHHPRFPSNDLQNRVSQYVRTMPSTVDRWPEMPPAAYFPADHFGHPVHHHHHHHLHPHNHPHSGYPGVTPYDNQRSNPLLQNTTLPPPVGELNSTGNYYPAGAPSNLGSAVATSMNLTNSTEPMGADTGAVYKSEPNDLMCYTNPTNDTINQTDIFSTFLEDPPFAWPTTEDAFSVGDGLGYGAAGTTVQEAAGAGAIVHPGATTTTTGATDERMDASSDSAVSSMGSERVPSLSDGEWMETGSNSSHTQPDSQYAMDYHQGKYRLPYECYVPTGRSAGHQRVSCQQQADRAGAMAPVAQKKHHMFGKRCFQDQPGPMTPGAGAASSLVQHPAATPIKYDYDAAQSIAAGLPGPAYSGPIEGATGPQPEIKYSCSVDFARHHHSARSNLEQVHHNHTYHLPPESSGALQRPISRDKKARKSEADEHLSRDEKRARSLNVPIPVNDIINLPMDEFNERLSKYDLSESQLSLIRDIRRRGKNKVAAQNCRKRKLDQINNLSDEVKAMRNRKMSLLSERSYMLQEVSRVKAKFSSLYQHILENLRDPEGRPYDPALWSLQLASEGNVVLVPRANQSTNHYTRSIMDPTKKNHPHHHQHHHHHQDHKE